VKVLPTKSAADQISQILHSSRFPELIERLKRDFDIVLVDAPPLMALADARLIGRLVDGVALVIRSGQTDKASLLSACQSLIEDGIPLYGTVLNDWKPQGGKRGYNTYYGYQERVEK
jgi:Mrp family chromosome partitioning ATPase